MTRASLLRAALLAAGLLVIGLLVHHFGLDGVVAAVSEMNPARFALYFVLALGIRIACALRWRIINAAMGARLPLTQLLAARVAGDAVGGLFPAARVGGDPLRILLVHRQGVPGVDASAGVALDRMLEVTGNTLAVLAYLSIYSAGHALPHVEVIGVVFSLLLVTLMVTGILLRRGGRPFSFPLRHLTVLVPRLQRLADIVSRTEDSLTRIFRETPRAFVAGLLITIAIEVVVLAEYHFLFAAFDLPADVATVAMVLLGGGLARAIPTPAGLGALEASGVAMVGLVSGRPDLGFIVGLALRLDDLLWMSIGLVTLAVIGVPALRPAVASPTAS